MRKAAVAGSIALSLTTLASVGEWWERVLSAAVLSIGVLSIVILQRRFTRAVPQMPWVFHVAAAIAVVFGVIYLITGAAHSAAVVSLALKEPDYGPLQILRFTTGAMLLYTGAMSIALYRALSAGRQWAVATGLATGLLFWMYLAFLIPLPDAGAPLQLLGPWTVYLLWLGAAMIATRRRGASGEFSLR